MEELRKLFLARVYTNDMAKCCLMHLVQKYHPEQRILLRTMTANQIATYLLQLDPSYTLILHIFIQPFTLHVI